LPLLFLRQTRANEKDARLSRFIFDQRRPNSDIEPISESACFWVLSRRSCSTPAHHSKRAFRFSISTFLIGCLGPFPEIPCGSKMLVCSSEADPQPTLRTQRKPGPKQKAPEVIITISFLWACSDHHSWVLALQPLQGYDPAAGDRVLHRPELPFPPRMEKST
jgi:hypothetical protein